MVVLMINNENLKQCRKILKLNQAEFSGVGMSREYISDVERGKSRLTNDKAKVIITKLMLHSLSQNTIIPLELNNELIPELGLLNEYSSYKLIMYIRNTRMDDIESALLKLNKLTENTLPEFRFFIYIQLSKIHYQKNNIILSYADCKIALDIAFSIDNDSNIFNLNENIKFFSTLAFSTEKATDIIRYYKRLIELNKLNEKECVPFTYYNLALFEKIDHDYLNAIKHLDIELANHEPIELNHYIDIVMMKASLLFKLSENEEGLLIYNDLIRFRFGSLNDEQKSMVTSNLIYFYIQNNLAKSDELLLYCEEYLASTIANTPEIYENRHRVFANLGLLKKSQGNNEVALSYFEKAFTIYFNNFKNTNSGYIHLLDESFEVYYNTNKWNNYLNYLNKTDVNELNNETEGKFIRIIAKVFFVDENRSNFLLTQLFRFTE